MTGDPSIQANGRQPGRDEPEVRIVRESSEDVTIDVEGRIFRFDGSQITEPGLEPEKILRGLEEVASGRMISLAELRARRA
jgi:hypothetical protein